MTLGRDDVLLLAVLVAVACPTVPLIGYPTNVAAALLLGVLMASRATAARLRLAYLLMLVTGIGALSTIAGAVAVGGAYSVNPNAFGPLVRLVVCGCVRDPLGLQRRLLLIGAAASAFAILQFVFPAVAEFTSNHYLGAERSAVFTEDFSGDSIVRVIGVYENPSSVALLAIALILLSVHAYARRNLGGWELSLFVIVNAGAGVLSLSKIFFAGVPLLLIQLLVLRFGKSALVVLLALALGAWVIYHVDSPTLDVIRYALDSTLDPDAALKVRYLADQEEVVANSWLFGHGVANVEGVNVNDSAYLVLGYLIGAFGAAVLALHILYWILSARRSIRTTFYLVLAAVQVRGNELVGDERARPRIGRLLAGVLRVCGLVCIGFIGIVLAGGMWFLGRALTDGSVAWQQS
jgi:hypothetical protein